MHVTIEQAIQLLNLSSESEPKEDPERELLLRLVDGWLDKHGKSWVKNNPLLQHEWRRQKALLSELSGRGNEGATANNALPTSAPLSPIRGVGGEQVEGNLPAFLMIEG